MGNCNQNFQDVGDLDYQEHFEVSQRVQSQYPNQFPNQYSSQVNNHEPPSSSSPAVDQEAIHNTIIRKEESRIPIVEQVLSRATFPHQPEVISISEPVQQKIRPKLEELDLSFYHSLGLPDYEYPPFPEEDQHLFEGVETYELKDNYGVKYVGQWSNNNIHGNGVLLSNTAKYIGQFKQGLKHYHGREILRNEVYEGQFDGGRRKGEGVRYTPELTEKGLFDDQFIQGEIIYLDGRVETKESKEERVGGGRPEDSFRQDDPNVSIGSLYTDKYHEESQLPADWYEEEERKKIVEGSNRESTNNYKSSTFR